MLTNDLAATALLTGEHEIASPRLSAADAARARHSVRAYRDAAVTDDQVRTGRQPKERVVIVEGEHRADAVGGRFRQPQIQHAPYPLPAPAGPRGSGRHQSPTPNPIPRHG